MCKFDTTIRLVIFVVFMVNPLIIWADKIAYLSHVDYFWQVWVMESTGENKDIITSSKFDKVRLSWFPDGKHLLVNDNNGNVYKVNIDTKQETLVELPIKGTLDAVISPDGEMITFSLSVADSIDNNHIWLVDKNGKNLRKLTNMGGLQHEPVWGPDMQWIYFLSGVGGQTHDIWKVSIDTNKVEQVTFNNLYNFDVALTKQGFMAFSSNRSGNYEIWTKKANEQPKQLTNDFGIDSRPSWSIDGKNIIFESSRNGVINLYKMRLANKSIISLTNEKYGARFPVWYQTEMVSDK